MTYQPCNHCGQTAYQKIRPYPGFEGVDLVQCDSCGLMQAQPVPKDAFLFNYYQSSFGNDPVCGFGMSDKSEKGFRLRATLQFDFVKKWIPLKGEKGKKILDVGCHAGSFLSLFKDRGWEVTGVDPNPRSSFGDKWYGIKIQQSLFQKNLFPEKTFDAMLHSHALEHVPDPKGYLAEFYRLLKPGGWLFIEVPNECRENVLNDKVIPHLYFFTPESLTRMAEDVGFEVVSTRVLGIGPRRSKFEERKWSDWLKLRWQAKYDAKGRINFLTLLPFFGRYFKEDRYFKDFNPRAKMLRTLLRRPAHA